MFDMNVDQTESTMDLMFMVLKQASLLLLLVLFKLFKEEQKLKPGLLPRTVTSIHESFIAAEAETCAETHREKEELRPESRMGITVRISSETTATEQPYKH